MEGEQTTLFLDIPILSKIFQGNPYNLVKLNMLGYLMPHFEAKGISLK